MKFVFILIFMILFPISLAFNLSENFENFNYSIISHPNPFTYNCNGFSFNGIQLYAKGQIQDFGICRAIFGDLADYTNITRINNDCKDNTQCLKFQKRDSNDINFTDFLIFYFFNLSGYDTSNNDLIKIHMKKVKLQLLQI